MGKKDKVAESFAGSTRVGLVVDSSGSMEQILDDANGALKKWTRAAKKAPGADRSTLRVVYFDDAQTWVKRHALSEAKPPVIEPGNSTALFDAVAAMILKLDGDLKKGDRALVVVVTDGRENASREYRDFSKLEKLIEERKGSGRWTFVFLASEMTSVENRAFAGAAGAHNSGRYDKTSRGIAAMGDNAAMATSAYMGSAAPATQDFFSPDQRVPEGEAVEEPSLYEVLGEPKIMVEPEPEPKTPTPAP